MTDSGNDVLTATPVGSDAPRASFSSQAVGFREVYAEAAAGGYDVASLYDSNGDDQFVGRADVSGLRTAQSYNEVRAFDEVHAYAVNGGADTADLYDSMGADTFVAREDFARMSGDGYFTRAKFFEHVTGHSTGGNDEAHLYDTAGDDTFFAAPAAASFSGDGWERRAENFARVFGYASSGNDTAIFEDSAGNDSFPPRPRKPRWPAPASPTRLCGLNRWKAQSSHAASTVASLYDFSGRRHPGGPARPGHVLRRPAFRYQAKGFAQVHGYANSGGIDIASLFDSAGDDEFVSWPGWARIAGGGYFNRVKGFDQVHAYAKAGGNDLARLNGSAGDDTFVSDHAAGYARMITGETSSRVKFFERVEAYATTGGNDVATLRGTAGDDAFVADPVSANADHGRDGHPGDAFLPRRRPSPATGERTRPN